MTTTCVVDTLQLSTFLSQAGAAIDAATRGCNPIKTQVNEAVCAADVINIIKSFSFSAAFLSAAVANCGVLAGREDQQAACAASVAVVVGSVSDLAMAGAGISYACVPDGKGPAPAPIPEILASAPPQDQYPPSGYLPPHEMSRAQRDYSSTTAFCAIYALQSTWFLARAALAIDAAVSSCKSPVASEALCAADVSGVIASFAAVTAYLSGAIATCSHSMKTPGAGCATYISMLVAGMAGVSTGVSGSVASCIGTSRRLEEVPGVEALEQQFGVLEEEFKPFKSVLKAMNITLPSQERMEPYLEVLKSMNATKAPALSSEGTRDAVLV